MSEEGVSDIDKRAAEVGEELLPPKSRKLYEQQYDTFKKWCRLKNVRQPTENALLVYFDDKSKAVCASTLWAHYSMLKSVINIREDIDISKFPKLLAFLKRRNEGFKPKKSRILTSEQVDQFLREAPDDKYLMLKVMNPLDAICHKPRRDAICVSQLRNARKVDQAILQERPDVKIFLPFRFLFYKPEELFHPNTYNKFLAAVGGDHVISLIDEISFQFPPSPPLSQLDDIEQETFCNGDNRPEHCGQNCMCTHMVDIPLNAIVEVVLVDEVQSPNLSHPFHLHGYVFNVVGIGRSPDKNVKKINLKHALDLDRRGLLQRQFNLPPLKDTIAVPNNGYVIFRFRADNPGYWLFHCHFLFHIAIGMNLVVHVGTQSDLPPVPPGFPKCGNHVPPILLHH